MIKFLESSDVKLEELPAYKTYLQVRARVYVCVYVCVCVCVCVRACVFRGGGVAVHGEWGAARGRV